MEELESILDRALSGPLDEAEHKKLKAALGTLGFVLQELDQKRTSLVRLRKLLFGSGSEKTRNVLGEEPDAEDAAAQPQTDGASESDEGDKPKRKGHGRNGAGAYTGAEQIKISHDSLHPGDSCPKCPKGKVYPLREPRVLVRITGQAPLNAKVFELERLRCNLCGEVFTATPPSGVGDQKYDARSASMIALLKYGSGLPFNRLAGLQGNLGIPLPPATQWQIVSEYARDLTPAYEELIRQAASGEVLHNDDTTLKILELEDPKRRAEVFAEGSPERTGVFTSGIVSVAGERKIALFFSGPKHAGENLERVLRERSSELGPPIQMCDALSRNVAGDFKTIVANCLVHARRNFVDVVENFPAECKHVLETLEQVYEVDAEARTRQLSKLERLRLHQRRSRPLMDELAKWLQEQFDEKKVEPNSGLGDAITYMQTHWKKLTRFLRDAGAPLDNNVVERSLKKAILHRKNSLFYKTMNGARVGDLFMSLVHTCELSGVSAFEYLTALGEHRGHLARQREAWLPWNFAETLARLRRPEEAPN